MNRRILIIGVALSVLGACHKTEVAREKPLYPYTTVGTYTAEQVDLLRVQISSMKFPLPSDSTAKLLSPDLVPDPWAIYDSFGARMPGKSGGRILDYWLNQDYVLRVAQGYYPPPEPGSKDEWAVIIRSSERQTYKRTP